MSKVNSSTESEGNRVSFMPEKYNANENQKQAKLSQSSVDQTYLEPVPTPTKGGYPYEQEPGGSHQYSPSQSYGYDAPAPPYQQAMSMGQPVHESSHQGSVEPRESSKGRAHHHHAHRESALRTKVNHFVSPAEPIMCYHWCLAITALCCCCCAGIVSIVLLLMSKTSDSDGKRGQASGYSFMALIFSLVAIALGTVALVVILILGISSYEHIDFWLN